MALELTPLEPGALSPGVARAVSAPGPARMMAARGMVPMGPRDLITVLYQLSRDADAKVAQTAEATADGLPDNILSASLGDTLDPRILDFYGRRVADKTEIVEKVLLNKAIHDDTLIYFAGKLKERELEILAGNQQRILGCPRIIEAMYFNNQARMSTVKRLLELAVRHNLVLDLPQYKEIAASIMGEVQQRAQLAAEEAEQLQALEEDIMDEAFAEAIAMGDEGVVGEMEMEDQEPDEKSIRLLDRPFLEKIRLAATGKLFHRMVLIRDTNKTVAMAVIQSAAVTDQEAARYAANRSLHEDIIRYIAYKKEWQKNYFVKLALVNNPKCPLAASVRLLNHLRPNDLRALSRSKNVPAALVQAARQLMHKRN